MSHRRAARVDNNQGAIVKYLLSIPGVSVALNHDDIFVGRNGRNYWFEIKNPERAVSKKSGKILESAKKKSQKKLEKNWTGHYEIVSTIEEILKSIGISK